MKMKSASQTAGKLTKKVNLALTVLAFSASPDSRADELCNLAFPTNWINPGTGDWFEALNWSYGVPDCIFPTSIPNGGTAVINTTTRTARACETFVSYNSGLSGNLIVDRGTLETCNEMHVGYQGTGTLIIKNGGHVTTTFGADIAATEGSKGIVTVDGTNSQWTVRTPDGLHVGGQFPHTLGGTGLLTVTNVGVVSVDGIVQVYKSGTLTGNGNVSTTNGTVIEGTLTPNGGTLTVDGNLTFSGDVATLECHVVPGSADNVNVSGVASLAGKISVTMTGSTFTAGTTYTLLHAAGGIDPNHPRFNFNSIKGGSGDCFTPLITYDYNNNNVNLYLSPCSN